MLYKDWEANVFAGSSRTGAEYDSKKLQSEIYQTQSGIVEDEPYQHGWQRARAVSRTVYS